MDDGDRRADVLVVGAGPAGSSAAWHLARAGRDVVVLEKARLQAAGWADVAWRDLTGGIVALHRGRKPLA